ncbi:hypothetical protein KAI87_04400, partial [Myxococcota bacterium]|nr:hypothetical protein [Myxococcota bacterium]
REALTYALRTESVREILENVLGVLGEDTTCKNCEESVYLVPLYHCRGLDTIFADLCPACGAAQNRYWMPRSQDHHDLINTTYMDFELVSEFIFYLADAPIIIQLLPFEVETLKVGDLKKRIFADFFKRYELELKSTQVRLWQDSLCIREGTPLVALNKSSFDLRFGPSSKLRENEALEILRYRIRTRFSQT